MEMDARMKILCESRRPLVELGKTYHPPNPSGMRISERDSRITKMFRNGSPLRVKAYDMGMI